MLIIYFTSCFLYIGTAFAYRAYHAEIYTRFAGEKDCDVFPSPIHFTMFHMFLPDLATGGHR